MRVKKLITPHSVPRVPATDENHNPRRRGPRVFNDLANQDSSHRSAQAPSLTQGYTKSKLLDSSSAGSQEQSRIVSQRCQPLKPRHSAQPPSDRGRGGKAFYPPDSNRRKAHTPISPQRSKKHERYLCIDPPPPPTPPEDCISQLPVGVPFPKKPAGCEVIPQTIEPGPKDRSTVYFTRNGVLGMPLQYMHNLDDMDDGDEPANLGLDPMKSCYITLVIAWPGYKEATYYITAYAPLYPTAPFVTAYGLRELTKRELAIETLRCIHRWMIEHPWSGERHEGIPDWKLSGEKSPGVSAKTVWLAMISPVGDGRWVTQLQKAPGP